MKDWLLLVPVAVLIVSLVGVYWARRVAQVTVREKDASWDEKTRLEAEAKAEAERRAKIGPVGMTVERKIGGRFGPGIRPGRFKK